MGSGPVGPFPEVPRVGGVLGAGARSVVGAPERCSPFSDRVAGAGATADADADADADAEALASGLAVASAAAVGDGVALGGPSTVSGRPASAEGSPSPPCPAEPRRI